MQVCWLLLGRWSRIRQMIRLLVFVLMIKWIIGALVAVTRGTAKYALQFQQAFESSVDETGFHRIAARPSAYRPYQTPAWSGGYADVFDRQQGQVPVPFLSPATGRRCIDSG